MNEKDSTEIMEKYATALIEESRNASPFVVLAMLGVIVGMVIIAKWLFNKYEKRQDAAIARQDKLEAARIEREDRLREEEARRRAEEKAAEKESRKEFAGEMKNAVLKVGEKFGEDLEKVRDNLDEFRLEIGKETAEIKRILDKHGNEIRNNSEASRRNSDRLTEMDARGRNNLSG